MPFDRALDELELADRIRVLAVPSGYPSPRFVNLVLRRVGGRVDLFESSASRPDIIEAIHAALEAEGVERLDAILVTHSHGDHAGSAGVIAGRGRDRGEQAPIHLHSAGYRFLTHPEATFLDETYEIFRTRSQWGLREYNSLSDEQMINHELRKRYAGYFTRTSLGAFRFVDRGELPAGLEAVPTPGHSNDCVLYFDRATGVAVPGDTIICTGRPEDPASRNFVVPIFTVIGQAYSRAFEGYLETIRRLRWFFESRPVRVILPPHGRFAIVDPMAWVAFAETYFLGLYRALCEEFLADADRAAGHRSFRGSDVMACIPTAGAHPVSTAGHLFGLLCTLVDEGFLAMDEQATPVRSSSASSACPPRTTSGGGWPSRSATTPSSSRPEGGAHDDRADPDQRGDLRGERRGATVRAPVGAGGRSAGDPRDRPRARGARRALRRAGPGAGRPRGGGGRLRSPRPREVARDAVPRGGLRGLRGRPRRVRGPGPGVRGRVPALRPRAQHGRADRDDVAPRARSRGPRGDPQRAALEVGDDINAVTIAAARLLSRILPKVPLQALEPTLVSRDPEIVEDRNRDPLVYQGGIRARIGAEILGAIGRARDGMARFAHPVLILHGGADQLTEPRGSRDLFERSSSEDKRLEIYDGCYHEVLNELPEDRARVRADVLGWIEERL